MGKGKDHGLPLGGWVGRGQQSTAASSQMRCRQLPSHNAGSVVCGEIERVEERSWTLRRTTLKTAKVGSGYGAGAQPRSAESHPIQS